MRLVEALVERRQAVQPQARMDSRRLMLDGQEVGALSALTGGCTGAIELQYSWRCRAPA
jgi:hypothetical protein